MKPRNMIIELKTLMCFQAGVLVMKPRSHLNEEEASNHDCARHLSKNKDKGQFNVPRLNHAVLYSVCDAFWMLI